MQVRFADFVIVVLGCVTMNNNGYSDCMGQKTDTCSCSQRAHVLSPRKLGFYWFIPIVDMEVAKISHVFKNCLNLLIVVRKIIMKKLKTTKYFGSHHLTKFFNTKRLVQKLYNQSFGLEFFGAKKIWSSSPTRNFFLKQKTPYNIVHTNTQKGLFPVVNDI